MPVKRSAKKAKPARKIVHAPQYSSKYIVWGFVCALLLVAVFVGYAYSMRNQTCATDQLVCPDGTVRSRVGDHCSFGSCPVPSVITPTE